MADFEITRGTDVVLDVRVVDEADTPVDLTGADVTFTAKRLYSDPDSAAVIQKTKATGGIVADGETGLMHVLILPADTALLGAYRQTLKYDVIVVADGRRAQVARGELVVTPAVTDPA